MLYLQKHLQKILFVFTKVCKRGKLGLEPTLAEETTDRWSPLGDMLVAGQNQSV